jgi:predicted MFS family arabinose efflux permease
VKPTLLFSLALRETPNPNETMPTNIPSFSRYQVKIILLLALVQFTVVLDFMVMSPLGDFLIKSMDLDAKEFSWAVSAYAFSAGASGLLAAGFADRFDRRKLLLFFYAGFIGGTLLCGLATTFGWLLFARIFTGLFGGVLGSISLAIVSDLFAFGQRGRVMGFIQMAFAVSQAAGIPVGLFLAERAGWQMPFFLIVGIAVVTVGGIVVVLRPLTGHLESGSERRALAHLWNTLSHRPYILPFLTTALLSIGGFLLMPFTSAFLVNNVLIRPGDLPFIYACMGVGSFILLPLIGQLADKAGKLPVFLGGSVLASAMILVYTNLGPSSLWTVIGISVVMFASIMSRMIPATALMTAIPDLKDRGAFMSVNASLQQVAGGAAAVIAGWVIVQDKQTHQVYHFDTLGYACVAVIALCAFLMRIISRRIRTAD